MSLENAMTTLAEAMNRYSEKIEKYGDSLLARLGEADAAEPAPAAAPTPKTKPGPKPKAKPEPEPEEEQADDDDGFGDDEGGEETESELTMDQVKSKLFEVKDKFGDKKFALELIKPYGYKALPEIQEKDFAAIYADAEKRLKKAK